MAASLNSNSGAASDGALLNNSCDPNYENTDADYNVDPFATENNGTARFMGNTGSGGNASGSTICGSNSSLSEFGAACSGIGSGKFDFHTMKAINNQGTSKIELSRSELLKMLFYLEGELQARDVVIAALRNERVKHLISQLRSNPIGSNDPHAAIFRDKIALAGNLISRQSSTTAVQAEMEVRLVIEQQMESLYQMVHKQRATHVRMVGILTESLDNNQRMLQELEEEKRKHEHDTAQGDDITYGLEMERTKLRQELEAERQQVKKLEKDLKKLQETLEFERSRQKQIVLLLIAERKKILMKYIEEGKRSEDLAQILSEEKQRSDSIAEGLEEESKKSLRMEAEIEKQACAFDDERKNFKLLLAKDEKRIKELESLVAQLKNENESLRKHYQQQHQQQQNPTLLSTVPMRLQQSTQNVASNLATKSRPLNDECGSLMVNIAKIVQPTATVSSVPVSGPTTGIARSISPGQSLRSSASGIVAPGFVIGSNAAVTNDQQQAIGISNNNSSVSSAAISMLSSPIPPSSLSQTSSLSGVNTTSLSSSPAPSVKTIPQQISPSSTLPSSVAATTAQIGPATQIPMAGIQRVIGLPTVAGGGGGGGGVGKNSKSSPLNCTSLLSGGLAQVSSNNTAIIPSATTSQNNITSAAATAITTGAAVTIGGGGSGGGVGSSTQLIRGVPPPIPPNKPIIPPKREPSLSRLPSVVSSAAANAAAASIFATPTQPSVAGPAPAPPPATAANVIPSSASVSSSAISSAVAALSSTMAANFTDISTSDGSISK